MSTPYYSDEFVTLYLGDCLTMTEWSDDGPAWLEGDVLVTDPPYGRGWKSGQGLTNASGDGRGSKSHGGIANDDSTATRDAVLALWGDRPAVVFGDPLCSRPVGAVQALVYAKAADAGVRGARAGYRRDAELVYLVGSAWPVGIGGRSSVLRSSSWVAGPTSPATRYGHPHAKPLDILEQLISACPPGMISDPFAGSGSTLVAAKALGRYAIGVEVKERYCEIAARRLAQDVLDFTGEYDKDDR